MNTYQRLLCFMKILVQNMGILHRNLIEDEAWFANHKQIDKWQGELIEQTDDLIETGIALGFKEPTPTWIGFPKNLYSLLEKTYF